MVELLLVRGTDWPPTALLSSDRAIFFGFSRFARSGFCTFEDDPPGTGEVTVAVVKSFGFSSALGCCVVAFLVACAVVLVATSDAVVVGAFRFLLERGDVKVSDAAALSTSAFPSPSSRARVLMFSQASKQRTGSLGRRGVWLWAGKLHSVDDGKAWWNSGANDDWSVFHWPS